MPILFSLLFSLMVGAAETAPKIVFVGDSLTEGYGVARDKAYPALIQKKLLAQNLNYQVINAGISGSTSASAKKRVEWQLKAKPFLIVLALGANDGLRGLPVKSIEENLNQAVEAAARAKVKVLLAGMKVPPNYGAEYARDFEALFRRVADRHKVAFLPFILEGVGGRPDLNQSDGIHPTEKGQEIVADTVFKAIKGLL